MAPRKVVVEITGDSKPYAKATDDAVRTTEGFADRMKKVGMDLKGGFLQGIGIGGGISVFDTVSNAVGSVVNQVGKAIDLASDKAEAASKANVLFGESYSVIEDGSRRAATAVGMSSGAYIAAAGDVGNLLKNMGIAGQEAASMSKNMLQLAADVGSFNNADPSEVVEAMGAAFRGESDPIQRFGVFLSAAKVEAKALSMGLKNGKGPLTDYAKAMATYQIILEQTASAQGDFARTADGKANSDRINAAKAEEAWTRLGEVLTPLYQKAMPMLASATTGVIDLLTSLGTSVGPVVDGALTAIANTIDAVGKSFTALRELMDPSGTEWDRVTRQIREQAEALGLDGDAAVAHAEAVKAMAQAERDRLAIAEQIADIDASTLKLNQDAFDAREQVRAQIKKLTDQEADAADIQLLKNELDRINIQLQSDLAPLLADRATLTGDLEAAQRGATRATSEDARITGIASKAAAEYAAWVKQASWEMKGALAVHGDTRVAIETTAGAYTDAAYRMRGSGSFGSVILATAEATKTGTKEITSAMLRLAHSGETVPGSIRQDLSPLAGIVKGSLQRAKREAEEGMADLNWALEHPMQGEKLERLYRRKLREAYQKLHQAQQTGNTIAVAKAQALIDDLESKMNELRSVRISIQTTLDNRAEHGANSRGFEYRASGGPVKRNKAYIVGEERAEVFVPDQDGTIIPSIAQATGGGSGALMGGGGSTTNVYNLHVSVPPTANLADVGREITRALKAFGQGGGQASMRAAIGVR
jgi:hypothetical protein